ncbi:aminoglycoside N(3)-acetyltransferase [Campylobacter lari]|uniref:AAC(3) family N-acetyltransferase n=1 Tax=Campylobacter lari TaxID=201 RepID=UPI001DA3EF88|nr:aminoglycoside N(3)-acetyltransferase [Campylobacter lari]EHL8053273.1 aminoglycoside N(3)-acetyltransferase [Campylobacter lari]MCR2059186.1 AAC(3) family N-acetyltransferase [Campylobacter lari subsp. concheus]MCR2074880.1 AAC(3) family N-acetyltransferase [Campylobacter lari subsp. concheus]
MILFEHKNKKYSYADLIDCLQKLQIKKGDILCIHSDLIGFGKPQLPREEFLKKIIECFEECVGKTGTIIMPTFTYSFCKQEIYDKIASHSSAGVLTNFFRSQENVKRTNDPLFSFAVKGAKENIFLSDTVSCFSSNSVYGNLLKMKGKLLLFGTQRGHTFCHFIEEQHQVPYRYFKVFNGIIKNEKGIEHKKNIKYFVRKLNEKSKLDGNKIRSVLYKNNSIKQENFAGSFIQLIQCEKYFDNISHILKENSRYFVK